MFSGTALGNILMYYHVDVFRNCIGQHFAMNEEKVIISKLLRR
jgi:hypothetical protein